MKTLNENEEGARVPPARATQDYGRRIPRAELRKNARQKAFERAEKSANLATAYPRLKALTVDLLYFDREIVSWGHGLRYRANLETAKSVLHFACPSPLCDRGGFDLSKELSAAVLERRKRTDGEVPCPGSRDQDTGKAVRCKSVLHFKMNLAFIIEADAKRRIKTRKRPARIISRRKT